MRKTGRRNAENASPRPPAGLEGVLLGKDSQLQPPARVSETATASNQTAERNPSGQRSDRKEIFTSKLTPSSAYYILVAEGAVASFHWVLRSRVAGALYKMKSSGRRRPWKFRPTSRFWE